MKRFWNAFWPMLAVGAACYFAIDIILGGVFLSLAFAIAGKQYAGLLWVPLMTVFCMAVMLIAWYLHKSRDATSKREYLAVIGGETYDRRADKRLVSRDPQYRDELVSFALISSLLIFLTFGPLYLPICFPVMYGVFHVFNRRLWLRLHKAWAEGRMHQNPNH